MTDSLPGSLLDTSVIIRYLTGEPRDQSARATALLDGDRTLILSEVALAEAAFVLTKVFRAPRHEVVDALMAIVQKRSVQLLTLPKSLALQALALCADSNRYSFADVLLWAQARHSASVVITFDQDFPAADIVVERP